MWVKWVLKTIRNIIYVYVCVCVCVPMFKQRKGGKDCFSISITSPKMCEHMCGNFTKQYIKYTIEVICHICSMLCSMF